MEATIGIVIFAGIVYHFLKKKEEKVEKKAPITREPTQDEIDEAERGY